MFAELVNMSGSAIDYSCFVYPTLSPQKAVS